MCTVSIFYKGNNDFVLTSNRDEAPNRNALTPNFYNINNVEMLMPKDEQSGGSWIGESSRNRVVCLLNGGFKLHERKKEYRQSRGVVVTDFLTFENIDDVQNYNYEDIEPFTIVIADWNTSLSFYEIVWDGSTPHFSQLSLTNHIWSSSTLYNQEKKEKRQAWFNDYKSKQKLTSESVLEFHKTAGKGNDDFGVIMNRGFVKTTSITQVEKSDGTIKMEFYNLKNSEKSSKTVNLAQALNE